MSGILRVEAVNAVLLALAPLVRCPSQAQEKPAQEAPPAPPPAEVLRLDAWPPLDAEFEKTLKTEIEKLRKAHTEEMVAQGEAALRAAGAGVVPALLPVLGYEKDPAALKRIEGVLLAHTGAAHTRLLAREFEHRLAPVRTWVLRRCGSLPDPGIRAAAEKALSRARKSAEKAEPADRVAREELYAAALAATSSGSLAGLDVMKDWAQREWGKRRVEMYTALEAVRGPAAVEALKPMLSGERKSIVAGLNLLSGCGDKPSTGLVKPFLDDTDNSIRVAAINALRGIVDGEGPVVDIPVFEAIELAKKWKGRI